MEKLALEKIIIQVKKGKVKNFEKIVHVYEHKIYGFVNSIVKDKQESEDLTQEVFYKVYKNLKNVDLEKSFSSWMLTIARNVSYDHLRKHSKLVVVDHIDGVVETSPESDYLECEFNNCIDRYVQELPEHLSALIMMKYFEELSYKEMGERQNIDIKTVKWQLYDARKKLMKIMDTEEVKSWHVK